MLLSVAAPELGCNNTPGITRYYQENESNISIRAVLVGRLYISGQHRKNYRAFGSKHRRYG
jgi:hypothetical protein